MNINRRGMVVGWGMVLLAGCSPLAPGGPATPNASPIDTALCSDASIDAMKEALRDVPSYAFQVEGYIEQWEPFTGSEGPMETPDATMRRPTKSSGAYVAPDRMTEEHELVNQNDDITEAERQIGEDVWVRFIGSPRWEQIEAEPVPANLVLALVDQPLSWALDNSDQPGHCSLVGTSADGPIAWTVKLTAPAGSDMPTNVAVTRRIDQPAEWNRATVLHDEYVLQPDAEVTIDSPAAETGPATEADLLYHLERRGCVEPPCDVSGIQLSYEAHNGAIDLFGYEGPEGNGYVWFEDGSAADSGSNGPCPSEWEFSYNSSGEQGDTQWIGGPMTVADSATMHVRLLNGQETEHTISAPAYIVPAGIVGGPELESFSIVGSDGEELFHYDEPSPESRRSTTAAAVTRLLTASVTVPAMTMPLVHLAIQQAARIAAVGGVIATGLVYLGSVLIAPMPWPLVFGVVWLGFVVATILAARRWAYRPLLLPVMSLAFIVIALWVGQDIFGWAP